MNYYQHHIGDYVRATAHLTWTEDCAYRRLIEWYYAEEKPLPVDKRQVYRLIRAATKQERDAIDAVLAEFFHPGDDGFRHRRCDAELARAHEKSDKARKSAAQRWQSEGNANAHANAHANASEDAMRTHSEGNALHKPLASNHKPVTQEPPYPPPAAPSAKRSKPRSALAVEALPDTWRQQAAKRLPGWDLDGLFRSFCNHHTGKGTLAASWAATWGTWLDNAPQFSRQFAPPGHPGNGQRQSAEDRNAAFAAEWTGGLMGRTSVPETIDMEPDGNERIAFETDRR